MSVDRIIFPRPKPQYNEQSIRTKDENSSIQFIDSPSVKNQNEIHRVPVMSMVYKIYEESCDIYILFFHGNAEDLGSSMQFLKLLRESLRANIIAVEYPGYGIYDKKVSAEQIKQDALKVYDSLVVDSGIDQSKIFVFGRSIGTGPACEIGARRRPGGVILLSAFTSIKKLSGELAFSLVSYFIKERFNNIENVCRFSSPCLLIHGQADSLIKHQHSQQLQEAMRLNGKIVLAFYPEKMTHNQFQIRKDIIRPIDTFLKRIQFQQVKIQTKLLPDIFKNSLSQVQLINKNFRQATEEQNKQLPKQQQQQQSQLPLKLQKSESYSSKELQKNNNLGILSDRKHRSQDQQRQINSNNQNQLEQKKVINKKKLDQQQQQVLHIEVQQYEITEKKEERSNANIYKLKYSQKSQQDKYVIQPIQPYQSNILQPQQQENHNFQFIKLQNQLRNVDSSPEYQKEKIHQNQNQQYEAKQKENHHKNGEDDDIKDHQSDFMYDQINILDEPPFEQIFSENNVNNLANNQDQNKQEQKQEQEQQEQQQQEEEEPYYQQPYCENYTNEDYYQVYATNEDFENQVTTINQAQQMQVNHANNFYFKNQHQYNENIETNEHIFMNNNNSIFQKIDDLEICN
ncbi:alpha/beta superfamily hydrolase (macronuclear) [Tetrahymena thermophila SB210]|uniref:Alpha/beta superfamily hydrolase n=1 Tax=Tetrahymena thermophila (strain SB210) TaxID=312017 RepID=Q23YT6_TETTS|nr:alpha/beta superfamily hydrolase [Tetrahymena thermophila SB210]EAS01719.3 alpha/beta superfamily hydrolase [Tetrahymena thermophila SB210]|eukprot:XP_001021964.3 alpha/beta superfamily hydrolase [Tetrahymena thermophila SB210]